MKKEILEIEICLLVLKYGIDEVLKALALVQDVSVEELKVSIKRLEERKLAKPKRSFISAVEVVSNMKINGSEKAALLRSLALRFDNKTFLPVLRDVRTLLDRFHVETRSIKSRQESVRKLFDHLASLPMSDLKNVDEDNPAEQDSVFSELAGEIIGARNK